mgnify:CR=1 FL=1
MQLVAYGAQDVYLTGNPQITFFKVVYRRHTNFSIEAIQQTWAGEDGGREVAGAAGRCTATIERNGDLIYRMYLEIIATPTTDHQQVWKICNPGSNLIDFVELEIGGQRIDKQYGHWMGVWSELTQPNNEGNVAGFNTTGTNLTKEKNYPLNSTHFQRLSGMGGVAPLRSSTYKTKFSDPGGNYHNEVSIADTLYIPLQFWFCRNPGLALPLIALQYHEVKVILEHRLTSGVNGVLTATAPSVAPKNTLWVDYIYLDTDERRRFAQVAHEYLIEQVQHASFDSNVKELDFNHPVKELIWTGKFDLPTTTTASERTPANISGSETFQLKLNGQDRFSARNYKYFSRTQIMDHHTGSGGVNPIGAVAHQGGTSAWNDSICVYSFALNPEEHQPSGTCNFSRIDSAQLKSGTENALEIYAVNYNVLRIMSGMGGLAYSS